MEWLGIKFTKVEAESRKEAAFDAIAINLDINDMALSGSEMRILFSYSVSYKPDIARLRFEGYVKLGGQKSELEKIQAEWKKQKTIPRSLAEPLVNVIKFNAETNGVLVAKSIGIVPPIIAPRIEISGSAPKISKMK
jgi:hypothetical protein